MTENMESSIKNSETEEVEHVISQKDIQDFWDHVSTEERINDVCTTFVAESKQVTSKLYAQNASVPEKFAVANFLLQVGALKFQVQPSATEQNVYHTVIILQKPDIPAPAPATDGGSKSKFTPERMDEGHPELECQRVDFQENGPEESDGDSDEPWKREQEKHGNDSPKEQPRPKTPEHHECPNCNAVLTSLWELDLHVLSNCADEEINTDSPRGQGRPRKRKKEKEQKEVIPRKRGRPRKISKMGESVSAKSPIISPSKRKRGRPRKVITETPLNKSSEKTDDANVIETPPGLRVTRNGRVRRMPLKLLDTVRDTKETKQSKKIASMTQKAKRTLQKEAIQNRVENDVEITKQKTADEGEESSESEHEGKGLFPSSKTEKSVIIGSKKEKTECKICFKKVQSSYFAKHMACKHHQNKKFKCSTCKKKFGTKAIFKSHILVHRNLATNNLYECDICENAFPSKAHLHSHKVSHKIKNVKCDICDKYFAHQSMMLRHRNNVHTRETSYPCTLCSKVYYLKHRLRDHMVIHTGKKEFKCDLCDMEFFLLNRLKSHKKYVHVVGKPFLCDICGSNFKSKSTLRQHHLTAHTDIKKFPCRECGKLFSRTSLRNQHERVHTGHNPYPCEQCGKSFRDKCKLQVHMNWHQGIRPFQCDICNKSFLIKGNLTKHSRLHTGERPYICTECGRGCVDSSQLKKHMSQSHGIVLQRQLTKGPERMGGNLPTRHTKQVNADSVKTGAETVEKQSVDISDESHAYTIATDALIEISQQLVEASSIPIAGGQVVVTNSAATLGTSTQQAASEVVSVTAQAAAAGENIYPVMLSVNENKQVAVPVTQGIGEFQSLELISL